MDKIFKPEKFDADPNANDSEMKWSHWYRTFSHYLTIIEELQADKLAALVNHVSPSVFRLFSESGTYDEAIDVLRALYVSARTRYTQDIFSPHTDKRLVRQSISTCKL